MTDKLCRECGSPVTGTVAMAVFCSGPCRKTFNNRRAMRGAKLYDLWMSNRYDRGRAKALKVMTVMTTLGQQYRQEDVERSMGGHVLQSWLDPEAVTSPRSKVPVLDTSPGAEGSPDG